MASKSDYYNTLGVTKSASPDELKKAYRKQALEWHPDRHKDDKEVAEKKFKEINEAYQVLSDPQKKSAYDQFGHDAFTPGGGVRGGNPFGGGAGGPFTYTYSSSGGGNPFGSGGFGDPFDIFESFFGGANPFSGQRRPQVPRYSIEIDFMDAIRGVSKEVVVNGKKRKIKIPAGVGEATRINFDDFILSVSIKPHDTFEREGDDIYVRMALPYSLAVLGGEIKVPTVTGDVKIRIRPGTQAGTLRLRGKGAPHVQGSGRGDEYVRLVIEVPERLTREQKKLFDEIKRQGL